MAFAKFLLLTTMVAIHLQEIYGHGMMMNPVSRSSAWREGFDTPENYDDNELFCGGFQDHFQENNGKCGLCGDSYSLPRPRPNENGGIYGTGIIVQKYKRGQTVDVLVNITANHRGTFKFALCPLNKPTELETEECFDKYPLQLTDGSGSFKVPKGKLFVVPLVLPKDVTCEHCVFRWEYRAGNSWGICDDGSSGLGCGNQETFRNCADVTIYA